MLRRFWLTALALLAAVNAASAQTNVNPLLGPPAPPLATTGLQNYPLWPYSTLSTSSVAPTQNTARCAPFYEFYAFHADQLAISVTTLGTGPLNVALYTDAIDATSHKHQPQTLVTDPSVTFTVTGTGLVTAALGTAGVGVQVAQGLNWICFNDTNSADAVRFNDVIATAVSASALVGAPSAAVVATTAQMTSLSIAETAGTTTTNWPSFVGATFAESTVAAVPNVAIRVATVP